MRAAEFIKNIVLVAAFISSTTVQTTELVENLDLAVDGKVLDNGAFEARYDRLSVGMMDQIGVGQTAVTNFKAQTYTELLTSFLVDSLDHSRTFLQNTNVGFSFKGHTWAMGSLID